MMAWHFLRALRRQIEPLSAGVGGTAYYRLKHAKGGQSAGLSATVALQPPWHA